MSGRKDKLRCGQPLRDDAARAAGNRDLSLPRGWHLDKLGFPVKRGGTSDTVIHAHVPRRGR